MKVGDVVWLKSGSPRLTVSHIRMDGRVFFEYFRDARLVTDSVASKDMLTYTPTPVEGS